jgi:hypothetical protein
MTFPGRTYARARARAGLSIILFLTAPRMIWAKKTRRQKNLTPGCELVIFAEVVNQ